MWTSTPREWPSATSILGEYLNENLAAPVYWTVPNPRPATFLIVRRIGTSGAIDPLDGAVMAVEIWSGQRGDSPKPADVLASQVRELIRQLPLSDFPVTMSRITNYAQLPDFESGCPRVILQCQLHIQAD